MDTSFNSQPADVAQVWNLTLTLTLTLTTPIPLLTTPALPLTTPTLPLTAPTLRYPGPFKVWNLRGLANNAWHRVPVTLQPEASEDA